MSGPGRLVNMKGGTVLLRTDKLNETRYFTLIFTGHGMDSSPKVLIVYQSGNEKGRRYSDCLRVCP